MGWSIQDFVTASVAKTWFAVVELGLITLKNGDLEIVPIYVEGYHYDIMSEYEIFENEIEVNILFIFLF